MPAASPQLKQLDGRQIKFRENDLQTVNFAWGRRNDVAPLGAAVVGTFTPAKSYFMPSIRVNQELIVAEPSALQALAVSTTPVIPVLGQSGNIGVNIYWNMKRNTNDFMNWLPYGWYLPVGKAIYIISASSVGSVAAYGQAFLTGSATLYLMETFEQ